MMMKLTWQNTITSGILIGGVHKKLGGQPAFLPVSALVFNPVSHSGFTSNREIHGNLQGHRGFLHFKIIYFAL